MHVFFTATWLHAQKTAPIQASPSILNSLRQIQSCDNSVMLPGNPAVVTIGDLDVPGNKITVEAVINRSTPYTGGSAYAGNIVSKHDRPVDANYLLRPNHAEITTTNGYFKTPDICEIKLNKTYHVAMVYDGSTLKFYRNGFLMSSINASGPLIQSDWTTVIGSRYFVGAHNENFIGYINEVRIWNVARTQTEIRNYMGTSLPNPTTQVGLLAYYTFDNLQNKQGNSTWDATMSGGASLNQTNPTCAAFIADSCDVLPRANYDFVAKQDVCNPLSMTFSIAGNSPVNQSWDFGDGSGTSAGSSPTHIYPSPGNYTVSLTTINGTIPETVKKTITVTNDWDDIIVPRDLIICKGSSRQIQTRPSLSVCWSPTTYLNDPKSQNPVTSSPHDITYYLTAETTGNNLITNGNFSAGNTGFGSSYTFAGTNVTEGQYFVGTSPRAWNAGMDNCSDHTSGTGNMLIVNGNTVRDIPVWTQTIAITPNTNYAFSTWIQALWAPNPAQLQFSINGQIIGGLITAALPTCTWNQFYTTWNSGNATTAVISIVNKNALVQGNDFALDDISLAPVFTRHDSVNVIVEHPDIKTNRDTLICAGTAVQLNVAGAQSYSWTPGTTLSSANTFNPVAKPATTTEYIVTGTSANGCVAKDTVLISVHPKPSITKSNDTLICPGASVQLFASGGFSHRWYPSTNLSNPGASNPVAIPTIDTKYFLETSDANNCNYIDSVAISIRPLPAFRASADTAICDGSLITLRATGGDKYLWISNTNTPITDPGSQVIAVSPPVATKYTVQISESVCNYDTAFDVSVNVNPVPVVSARKSNDIDCKVSSAELTGDGASRYNWSPASRLSSPSKRTTTAIIDTTTTFVLTGMNQYGCSDSDTVSIVVSKTGDPGFMLPNAFTPNSDGRNDCFGIKKWGNVQLQEFSIYNRWGQKIFTTKDVQSCWDGRFNGQLQGAGGYVYVIKARSFCGDVERKGMVMLVR